MVSFGFQLTEKQLVELKSCDRSLVEKHHSVLCVSIEGEEVWEEGKEEELEKRGWSRTATPMPAVNCLAKEFGFDDART
jgi:hypothetical protein